MTLPLFYRPAFGRHLHHLVINGFYARDLDADDFAFIERVRETGSANSSLPSESTGLLEEMEYWKLPYAEAPGVERRLGPLAKLVETEDQVELRNARKRAWAAKREVRERERAIAAAEMAAVEAEWLASSERRKRREAMSDREWDAADPRNAKPHKVVFGKVVDRHFVPQWRYDERRERVIERGRGAAAEVLALAHEMKAIAERLRLERELAEVEEAEKRLKHEQELLKQEQVRLSNLAYWQEVDSAELEEQIEMMVKSTPGQVWTVTDLMRAVGYGGDREAFKRCLVRMSVDGRLKIGRSAA